MCGLNITALGYLRSPTPDTGSSDTEVSGTECTPPYFSFCWYFLEDEAEIVDYYPR